ncbi:hypothetical protein [Desulfovibrio inopinatus]|uniref:hypothetical protein n=1 Tax=Desulfovibrio inopinatus TaxID=102109 RepID=UPI0004857800|nr:hypothetical protein [Desulfovibrio inopinatus]
MSFFQFVKNFGKQKAQDAGKSIVQSLASWDPEAASAAEIESMEERLNSLTQKVAEARQSYQKEKKEADEIEALYNQRLKAAEILQEKLTADPGNSQIETAMEQVVATLEEMQPDIEREIQEAEEAKAFMQELEDVAKIAADKLKTARKTLDAAKRDMERAKIREGQAKEQSERAAELAGLRKQSDDLGSALDAMRREADKANAQADAARTKAKLLAPTKQETVGNDALAEAMKEAAGEPAKPTAISDRLAALKRK